VVFLVEDLHWIDPSTLELIGMVLEQIPRAQLLFLATHRPDFEPPWRGREHVTPLLLSRLTRAQTEHLIRNAARGRDLPEACVDEIVRRADGVPLFAEELSRAVLESSTDASENGTPSQLHIPETLQDSLMARLDALGPARDLAQLGAVLGREFSYDLLLKVSLLTEERLKEALAEAVREDLLYQRGTPPHASYYFRHALVRDAAYQSLLRSTRQRHHLRVAETLTESMGETVEAHPELVAYHFTEGGDVPRAIPYWLRAGQRGIERSAHKEAVRHVRRGLALLETLPATRERSQRELELRTLLGLGLAATEGYAALEVEEAFARAGGLCRELGESEAFAPILFGQFLFQQLRANADAMRDLAGRLLALAERSGDPGLRVEGHLAMGQQHFWAGELQASRQHLEQVLSLYDPGRDRGHAFVYGQDPAVYAHVFLSAILWKLGRPAEGMAHVHECAALGEQIGHPFTIAGAYSFVAAHQYFRRDVEACLAATERMRSIAVDQHFPLWIAASEIYAGWSTVARRAEAGEIQRIRDGLAACSW
jgi:predicted ATPase